MFGDVLLMLFAAAAGALIERHFGVVDKAIAAFRGLFPALALVVLLGAGAAQAACGTVEMVRATAATQGHTLVELDPVQRAAVVLKFNNTEPKTDDQFNPVFVASDGGPVKLLLMFLDGCLKVADPVPAEWLDEPLTGKSANGGGGGGWIFGTAHAAVPGSVAPTDVWGKGDYVLLMFLSAFGGPLLMWFGLRMLDKVGGFEFKDEVTDWGPDHISMYLSFRWLGAAFVLGMWLLGLGIALAS